jgi:hypothetical protein
VRARTLGRLVAAILLAGGGVIVPARAQTSASFKLNEATFDNGGDPRQGSLLSAAHYKVTFDVIGGSLVRQGASSAGFRSDAGFAAGYPPPGEVAGVTFPNKTTLQWRPERSLGAYEVYRDPLAALPASFGTCFASGLTAESTTDASSPSAGAGFFYLVTVRNRLREEGTKGFLSDGSTRGNPSPCP